MSVVLYSPKVRLSDRHRAFVESLADDIRPMEWRDRWHCTMLAIKKLMEADHIEGDEIKLQFLGVMIDSILHETLNPYMVPQSPYQAYLYMMSGDKSLEAVACAFIEGNKDEWGVFLDEVEAF